MSLKKIRVLPDQYIVREGEAGETAFLVISGGLVAEINGKKIGKIETGETELQVLKLLCLVRLLK